MLPRPPIGSPRWLLADCDRWSVGILSAVELAFDPDRSRPPSRLGAPRGRELRLAKLGSGALCLDVGGEAGLTELGGGTVGGRLKVGEVDSTDLGGA